MGLNTELYGVPSATHVFVMVPPATFKMVRLFPSGTRVLLIHELRKEIGFI
jgi:hypothetical protein